MLFVFIAGVLLISRISVTFGILSIGLVIFAMIELSRIRFTKEPIAVAIIALSTMSLFWGWVSPVIGGFGNLIPIALFLIWGVFCIRGETSRRLPNVPIAGFLCIAVAVLVGNLSTFKLITPLIWGYDNNGHIPALSAIYRHHGFIYSGTVSQYLTNTMFANGYPVGQSGTWAFVMSIVNFDISGGYEIVNVYMYFVALMTAYLVFVITRSFIPTRLLNERQHHKIFLGSIMVAIPILLSQASALIWSGFPPFVWGCILIFSILRISKLTHGVVNRLLLSGLCLVLVSYTYPLLSPVPLTSLLFLFIGIRRSDFQEIRSNLRRLIGGAVIATVALILVIQKSLVVRNWVFNSGGIQPVEIFTILAIMFVVISSVVIRRFNFRNIPDELIVFVASTINFAVLSWTSINAQNEISYYPQKAGYLALTSGFVALGTVINLPSRFRVAFVRRITTSLQIIVVIGILLYSVSLARRPQHDGIVYTRDVIEQVRNYQPSAFNECLNRAVDITSDLQTIDNKQILMIVQDGYNNDLLTRWINGIRGRLNDPTYSLSIPQGQSALSVQDIIITALKLYIDTRVVIIAPQIPNGLQTWSDRIEFRYLDCSV